MDNVTVMSNLFYGCTSLTSVTFENTTGWFIASSESAISGTNIDVTNASANATNLVNTYYYRYWKKS